MNLEFINKIKNLVTVSGIIFLGSFAVLAQQDDKKPPPKPNPPQVIEPVPKNPPPQDRPKEPEKPRDGKEKPVVSSKRKS